MLKLRPPEPLRENHDTAQFDCGKSSLNEFLRSHALDKQRARLSRTYVVAAGHSMVVGYYTLAHVSVNAAEPPKKIGRGMPSSIPALLMARFAVDQSMQGQGLGRSLFVDALRRTWAVIEGGAVPVRFFIVDAKDAEAKAFYERSDMVPGTADPMRLFLSYETIRELFGED